MAKNDNHLLLRIPLTAGPLDAIIKKHNAVAQPFGSVWFGIRGQAPSSGRLRSLRAQLKQLTPTFFYVVQRAEPFGVFRSSIIAIAQEISESERHLVPTYYEELSVSTKAVMWLKVSPFKRVPSTTLDSLEVQTTRSSVFRALKGWSSFIIVSEKDQPPHEGQ